VQFRVLGPVEVHAGDGRPIPLARRQERCLLGILLLAAGRVVATDRLCALLWDDDPPEQARRAVQAHVSRIRGVVGDALQARGDGYLMRVPADAVDATRFRDLVDAATATDDLAERDRLLRVALALWRGTALQDAAGDRLRQRLCGELEELRLHATEESLTTRLALGRHAELIPELARLSAELPTRERLVELHMLALYRAGRAAEALDVYAGTRTRLADQLGLEPGQALQDLHRAILRRESPPSPPGTRARPAQLPPDPAGFTGRTQHLRELDGVLAGSVIISAIAGTAGVGKTALAVHWAHANAGRFPDGQLYVNLRGFDPGGSAMAPADAVRGFLDALDVPADRIPADPNAQVGLYRSLLADKRMLIVLDNARDADQVRPLLPGAAGCLALVTSRNELASLVAAEGAHPITLDLLTVDEARRLLERRLGAARVAAEPGAVDEIIDRCVRLPLALAVVSARAATHPRFPLSALAAELREARVRLDAFDGGDAATDVRAVFSWSYRSLGTDAARLFRLLGLHPGPDISVPASASLAAVPVTQARRLLAELSRAHLIAEHKPGRFALHDLLRAYATELTNEVDPEPERQAAFRRAFDHYLHSAYGGAMLLNPERYQFALRLEITGVTPEVLAERQTAAAWFVAEYRVILALVAHLAGAAPELHLWQLSWTLSDFLLPSGLWEELRAAYRTALDAASRQRDMVGQAHASHGIALAFDRQHQHQQAARHWDEALRLYQELGDRFGQARTHLNVAVHHAQRGHRPQALSHAKHAHELYVTTGHDIWAARALAAVGWAYARLGDFVPALHAAQQALMTLRTRSDVPGQADALDCLGHIHHRRGNHEQAARCHLEAVRLWHEFGDLAQGANALVRLGDNYWDAGERQRAGSAWQQALTVFEQIGHPDTEEIRAKIDAATPTR
jgi:DNA-binding SARP family transcriptional activator